ncbi:MAG: NCS2 family permease [Pyramidobacter sp.]|nr:NCS2 family permease [Pyramidobacter sp.]
MFGIKEAGSTVRTELMAGLTTFMTMGYIIFVNPGILADAGLPFDAVMVATCLASALGTALMGVLANYPIALSCGMGLNAFFAYTVVLTMKVSWQVALAAIFIEGLIFIVLTLTKIRESVVNGIPKSLKIGIAAGIGFFIALIGFNGAGIVVPNEATLVMMGDLTAKPVLIAVFGFIVSVTLECYHVRGAILWGILAATAASVPAGLSKIPESFVSMPPSIMPIFMKMDFSMIGTATFWGIVFTFFFVDFFDTVGTLVGVSIRAGLLDEKGNLPRARQALMADAVATSAGAVLGVTTVTSFIESASGVEQGGRTGLTAMTVSVLFLLAMFFSPVVSMVPGAATAPALVIVGVYMMMSLRDLDFSDFSEAIPAAVAVFVMPFTYSIGNGIEFGTLTYVATKLLTGKAKQISPILWLLALLFLLKESSAWWLPLLSL